MRVAGAEVIASVTSYGYGSTVNGCDTSYGDSEARVDSYHEFVDQWVNQLDPPAQPGQTGAPCTTTRDCAAGVCGTTDGKSYFCTTTCDPAAATNSCPQNLPCSVVDDIGLCMPPHGCDMGGAGAPSRGALLVALAAVALALAARRRRRVRR